MKKSIYVLIAVVVLLFDGCKSDSQKFFGDLDDIIKRGQLRAVTLESAISYYTVGDEEMGFDFALAQNLADYLGVELHVVIATSEEQLKKMLRDGEADFAAYKLPTTKSIRKEFLATDVEVMSPVVLVQPRKNRPIRNIMQLIDRDVYVQHKSKYCTRLRHLNDEIGGGINIKYISDTLNIEQIIYRVSKNKIPLTVADKDVAELGKKYFNNIDIGMLISIPLPKGWIVRKDAPKLDSAINAWYADISNSKYLKYTSSKYLSSSSYFDLVVSGGYISPYDSIFRVNAEALGWDWRFLAAIAFNESRFNPNTVSANGAIGIMQLMRRTGIKYGLNDSTFLEPSANIAAATKLISSLDKMFAFIADDTERKKVIVAAYNAGQGHIWDAIKLTEKYGGDPQKWSGNIEKYLLLKSKPKYYDDKVVKLGYFRAQHTSRFVKDVFATYNKYLSFKVDK
jgi:ABC transporter, substrate-binding protein